MCEEYMKRIFAFTEGMVLDSYSSLEVGEAATTSWIFLENGIKMMLFEIILSRLLIFLYFIYFFCHQALKWRVCDLGVFLDL